MQLVGFVKKEIAVDSAGTTLSYFDAEGPSERVLVCLHGILYRSPIFERLLPFAKLAGVRLVLLDRRGYGDSTDVPQAEVECSFDGSATAADVLAFQGRRANEVAEFLLRFAALEGINSRRLTLLSWSAGARILVSLLASQDLQKLDSILASLILWEMPYNALGVSAPAQAWNPLHDLSIPQDERFQKFAGWCSGYFRHPGSDASDASSLEYRRYEPEPQPTIFTMSKVDLSRVQDTRASRSYEIRMSNRAKATGSSLVETEKAFLLTATHKPYFENVKITVLWAQQTEWEVHWAAEALRALLIHAKAQHNSQCRAVQFVKLASGNHFLHWADPGSCMAAFKAAM